MGCGSGGHRAECLLVTVNTGKALFGGLSPPSGLAMRASQMRVWELPQGHQSLDLSSALLCKAQAGGHAPGWTLYPPRTKSSFLCDMGGSVGQWEWAEGQTLSGKLCLCLPVGEGEEAARSRKLENCGHRASVITDLSPLSGNTRFRHSQWVSSWKQIISTHRQERLI